MTLQLEYLYPQLDQLQFVHGHASLKSIHGAGCIENPKVLFLFMNPTARNVSSNPEWQGIRAPWLGTKNVWRMLFQLGFLSGEFYEPIMAKRPEEWTEEFSHELYSYFAESGIYITNFAKCTQLDAKALPNSVFREYEDLLHQEIAAVNPKRIISFGNQVSSVLLGKPISVSHYSQDDAESLLINRQEFKVFPTYYPVGQGQRNIGKAIERIKAVL